MAVIIDITVGRIAAVVEACTAVTVGGCIAAVAIMGSTAVEVGNSEPSVASIVAVGCIEGLVGKSMALVVLATMVGSDRLTADTGKDLRMSSTDDDHRRTVRQAAT